MGVKQISTGTTFSIALGNDGNVYGWGMNIYGVLDIPKEVNATEIIKVAAGDRHALALTSGGTIYAWGYSNFNQGSVPFEIQNVLMLEKAVDIIAGDLYSAVITNKGKIYAWGATMSNRLDVVPTVLQGNVAKAYPSSYNIMILTKDGRVGVLGQSGTALQTSMPEEIANGSVVIKDLAVTLRTAAAIDENGKLYVWGDVSSGQTKLPEGLASKTVTSVVSGRSHFVAIDTAGKLYTWGSNKYDQATVPGSLENKNVHSRLFRILPKLCNRSKRQNYQLGS
jgi:peptide/nickel transport system permease protein